MTARSWFIARVLVPAILCGLALFLASCGPGGVGTPGPVGVANPGNPRDTTPVVLTPSASNVAVNGTDKAIMDYSNMSQGYFMVKSYLGDTKVKVLVNVAGSKQYQYTLDRGDVYTVIPLSEGNGTYAVEVYENVYDQQYSPILSQNLEVTLDDEFLPFLYPSQYVNFNLENQAIAEAQRLIEGATSDVEALDQVYAWVVTNIDYDYEEAVTVASGYLPAIDEVYETRMGICFDYAVLTAAMLRSQRIPAQLVVGYAGSAYHAWIEVHCADTGEIGMYVFNGEKWVQMDPTFDAASKGTQDLSSVIGDGNNYQPLFYY